MNKKSPLIKTTLSALIDRFWFGIVLTVLAISLFLRVYHLDRYPLDFNNDSLAYAWVGVSLLANPAQPAGMSLFVENNPQLFWFSHYNYFDTVRRYDFRLVEPFFDQPPFILPLFGILPRLFGYTDFEPIPEVLLRLPAVMASGLTLLLTYLLATKLFNRRIGLLSLLILGLTPYYVFAHREAFLENFMTPLYLGAFLVLLKYLEKKRQTWFYGLLFLVMLAPLFKVAGIGLAAVTLFWLLKNREYKQSLVVGVGAAVSLGAYGLYGWLTDSTAFQWTLTMQATRGVYAASFLDFILRPEFYEPFRDGWYVFNFLAFLWLVVSNRKEPSPQFLAYTSLILITVVLATAGVNNNFPWYRYPLFPLLSMGAALFVETMLTRSYQGVRLMIFGLFGLANLYFLKELWPMLAHPTLLRLGMLLLLGGAILPEIWRPAGLEKIIKVVGVSLVFLALSINILLVLSYPKILCQRQECKLPAKIVVPHLPK